MKQAQKISALTLLSVSALFQTAMAAGPSEVVYTLQNSSTGNNVIVLQRMANGPLHVAATIPTEGYGTDTGLGNQGALAISEDGNYLYAVNAGSNDVSVFRVDNGGLELLDIKPVTGVTPVSVTVNRNLVYVANAGDDSIAGFRFDPVADILNPINGSHKKLGGANTGAAQISFNQNGDALVVTEKTTNAITSFALTNGVPTSKATVKAAGITPFGFAFGKHNQFFVSNASGGAPGLGTVSSYQLNADASVSRISKDTLSGQTAACWLMTTPDGRWAYTADTPAGAISSFNIDFSGNVALSQSVAATASKPNELAIAPNSRTLYSLNRGDNTIASYRINANGSLVQTSSTALTPTNLTGLVAQ